MEYKSIYCDQCAYCKTNGNTTWRIDAICSKCNNGSQQVTGYPLKCNDDAMAAASMHVWTSRCNGKTDYYKSVVNSIYGGVNRNYTSVVIMPSIKQVIFNPPATIVIWDDDVKTVVKAHNEQFDPEKGLAMAITKRALGNKGSYNNVINKHVYDYYKRLQKEAEKDYCKRDLEITEAIAKTVTFGEIDSENAVKALIDEAEKECCKNDVEVTETIADKIAKVGKASVEAAEVLKKALKDYEDNLQKRLSDTDPIKIEDVKAANDKLMNDLDDSAKKMAKEAIKEAFEYIAPYRIWYRVYENGKIVSSGMSLKAYKREGNAKAAAKKIYKDKPEVTWVVSQTNPWIEEKTDSE